MLDLMALSELEEPPASIKADLEDFRRRVHREVRDIPNGPEWTKFMTELEAIDAKRIPLSFRQVLIAETEREGRDIIALKETLEEWALEEPDSFVVGVIATPVARKAEQETRRASAPKPKRSRSRVAPKVAVDSGIDPEKIEHVTEIILERLGSSSERGLAEKVLIAGIRHRAREEFPTLLPHEIMTVLRDLKESGRVRYSAGRWSRGTGW
ncbi:MAG: hypothetical protein ACI8PZ_004851 [Myxococcota bacterium]|jgi:hypothetical protein